MPTTEEGLDGPEKVRFVFQILGISVKTINAPIFTDHVKEQMLQKATIQRLHISRNADDVMNVLAVEDPENIDLILLSGVDRAAIQEFLVWEPCEPAVEGCIGLRNPQALGQALSLIHI
eukprot:4177663-Pyramimonas_sp.AAC.1